MNYGVKRSNSVRRLKPKLSETFTECRETAIRCSKYDEAGKHLLAAIEALKEKDREVSNEVVVNLLYLIGVLDDERQFS